MKITRSFFLFLMTTTIGWAQAVHLPGPYSQATRIQRPLQYSIFFTAPNSSDFSEDIAVLKDYSINPLQPVDHLLISNPGTNILQSNLNGTINYSIPAHDIDARFISLEQDIDGDQFNDYVVKYQGLVGNDLYGVSGRTGALLYHTTSTIPLSVSQFMLFPTSALASGKDFDGDGYNDLVLSQIGLPSNPHGFELFSGRTGASLCSFILAPDTTIYHTGRMSFKMDDLEGDGINELIVGFPGRDEVTLFHYTGATTCSQIATVNSPQPGAMGFAVNTINDQDGDGNRDIVVSDMSRLTPFAGTGAVYILSSSTNTLISTLFSPKPQAAPHGSYDFASEGDRLLVEDILGDGNEEIIVGDPQVDSGVPYLRGEVYVYNAAGALLKTYKSLVPNIVDDGFGRTITIVRDAQQRKFLTVGVSANGMGRLDLFQVK